MKTVRFITFFFYSLLLSVGVIFSQENEMNEDELKLFEDIPVVISASLLPQKIYEAPANVRIITGRQIKQRGYFTLEDALSDLPGFQFRNILGFNSYVFQRGLPNQNDKILVMVDGIIINELNSGGFYGGGHYNLSNVKRIEVVYGPASALYGTNAISGIINIITRDPEDFKTGGHVSVLAGNFATQSGDFSYGSYNEQHSFGFSVSGMFKNSEKADLRGDRGDNNWTDNMENFEDDLSLDGKVKYKNFCLGLVFQDKQASRTTNYPMPEYQDYGTLWHILFFTTYANVEHKISPWSTFFSQVYYKNTTVMDDTIGLITSGRDGYQRRYYRPNDLVGFEARITLEPIHTFALISGLVLERENLAAEFSTIESSSPAEKPATPTRPDMMENDLRSFYLQGQYKIINDLGITAGFRYDNSSVYDDVITPRAAFVY